MRLITTTGDLATVCREMAAHDFVAVDTEFMRETTYWPKLCLIQARRGRVEAVIDPLAPGLDLAPFLALMANTATCSRSSTPRARTWKSSSSSAARCRTRCSIRQIAAMACGYGDIDRL